MLRSRRCTAPTPNGRRLRDSLRFTPEGLSDCERSIQGLEGGTKGSGVPEPPVREDADDFWARAARFCNDAYDADTGPSDSEVRASGCQACLFCLATSHIPLNGSVVWTSVRSDAYDADTDPNNSEVHVSVFLEAGIEGVVV